MRSLVLISFALLAACGGEDGERIAFSPGEFLVSTTSPVAGDTVTYTVTGKFGLAEVLQGGTRVSALSIPDRPASFVAVSDEPLIAIAWGNDQSEQKQLLPKASADLDPCGVVGTFAGELAYDRTGNVEGFTCTYPAPSPLEVELEILGGAQNAVLEGELLDRWDSTPMGDPDGGIAECSLSFGTNAWKLNEHLTRWAVVKAYSDRYDVFVEKQGDANGQTGCYTRWKASFPRE